MFQENSNQFNQNNFQVLNDNLISNLVMGLFSHINSKENFNYISELFINSLNDYKKKFPFESYTKIKEPSLNVVNNNEIKSSQYNVENPKNDYLAISNDIHSILSNCSELTSTQKLDFCNNQRYFMKMYLKEIVIKLNKAYSFKECERAFKNPYNPSCYRKSRD